ncbi:NAD(P)H-hydrate dehydratase [Gaoshiqia sediminis]|uniref:Bifunctional NAD(P)H-hydrate repair enzyme n=1 Tax=Gaoshiqia sediminis TaxID=2986998 RepID=A0AA41Y4H4_9BACT|nr:NAD(P)H-hydrate dehydratase [Gaoshiqia sediminis]MCW0483306.1 NAD(P)H-hydrate dehydratase [Gaoshiqia sediminis]
MKIFTTKQIAEIDQYTIQNEPIADIDLMERASLQLVNWLIHRLSNERKLLFFVGPGNNGGDALSIARQMADCDYSCEVYLLDFGKGLKGSPAINWQRLVEQGKVKLVKIASEADFPEIPADAVVIDGLFGSGLTRPLDGLAESLVVRINDRGAMVVAVDIPSGLFGEDNSQNDLSKVIRASHTLTFQFPKLSFFFPEHEQLLGDWEVLPIGLHPEAISTMRTPFHFLTDKYITSLIRPRGKFSHKGTYGHALLIAGSYGKMGAAVLASKACLRGGTGLLTSHVPHTGYGFIQSCVPEAMCSIDASDLMFTEFPDLKSFSAVGVGPGLGCKSNSQRALKELLLANPQKLVLDADALNILSQHEDWYGLLPKNSILTPHPKEFERLAGETADSWSRLLLQQWFSKNHGVIVVLKGAHTCITFPNGQVYFNTTGNPGMATAGSGDVLTGLILGLLAQPYSPEEAALLGVYLHGLAGDLAMKQYGQEALIAGDLIDHFGKAFLELTK